ncbi:hypothetical protein GCM10025857_23070 [Alicyclobacillus contaminans]|nr:hypothetical protein GCM10025857_23070 [Alicyclobacillus contaminans]
MSRFRVGRHPGGHTADGSVQQANTPYAKWGKLAVQQAQRCYPRAQVVDYLHLGRSEQGHGRAEEAFRLWLREGKQEWGVVVRLQFNVQTEALLRVRCERVP